MEAIGARLCCTTAHPSLFARPPTPGAAPSSPHITSRRSFWRPSLHVNPNLNAAPAHSPSTRFSVHSSSTAGAKVAEETSSSGVVGESDLLIVGPGVLGRLVAEQWRKEYPSCQIYGQTVTVDHHDELTHMGINPLLKGSEFAHKVPYIIFCAPPSRSPDYPGELRLAASNWNGEGAFLFTSSSAVFDCNDNGACNEDSPVIPLGRSPKTDVLLNAENVVVDSGGCVLRLAGLYTMDRGAHIYWLKKGSVEARPDHFLNLIHYEDAASLAVAILKKKLQSRILLGCDNHPVTRQDVMDLIAKSGRFSQKFEGFTGADGPLGKRLNNSKTREEIGWQPRYSSFSEFLGVSK